MMFYIVLYYIVHLLPAPVSVKCIINFYYLNDLQSFVSHTLYKQHDPPRFTMVKL